MWKSDIRCTANMTDNARVQRQIDQGDVDASPEAARKIARRIEDEGGFWGKRNND